MFLLGGIALAAHADLAWAMRIIVEDVGRNPLILGGILILYVALIATPFVPGAEIGLFVLAFFGASMAVPVYLATVVALTLSFLLGTLVPRMALPGSERVLPKGTDASDHSSWPETNGGSSSRWLQYLVHYRWLVLIVLINTPGNTLLGGGGGIAMAAGNSRAFTTSAFLFSVGVAVAPVPLAVVLADHFDAGALVGRWLENAVHVFGPKLSPS